MKNSLGNRDHPEWSQANCQLTVSATHQSSPAGFGVFLLVGLLSLLLTAKARLPPVLRKEGLGCLASELFYYPGTPLSLLSLPFSSEDSGTGC